MAEDDDSLLRLLAPLRPLGQEAILGLAKLARERADSLDNLIRIGRQDTATVDKIIRIGRQDDATLNNIIMLGVEPKETVGTIIQGARDRQNAERGEKVRWQILSKWIAILGGLGALVALGQVIPWLTALLRKLLIQ